MEAYLVRLAIPFEMLFFLFSLDIVWPSLWTDVELILLRLRFGSIVTKLFGESESNLEIEFESHKSC